MKTIYKYHFPVENSFEMTLPIDAHIIEVNSQQDSQFIWAIVKVTDFETELETRKFHLFGTGYKIDESLNLNYIGTFQLYNGELVFHLFEEIK